MLVLNFRATYILVELLQNPNWINGEVNTGPLLCVIRSKKMNYSFCICVKFHGHLF